ncbi:hypothetical protein ABEF91_007409 [Exophiala dermatitidis]
MAPFPTFELPKYLLSDREHAKYVLGGSAAPEVTLDDLISLSSDPAATEKALDFRTLKLSLDSGRGSLQLRKNIAALYSSSSSSSSFSASSSDNAQTHITHEISPEHVITATGTTGANSVIFQALLSPDDHAICMYPTYPQLLGLAERFAGEVSYWKSDPATGWVPDLDELRRLIKPSTKLLVLNNPNNPTGWHFEADLQRQIIDIAREKNIIVFVDEIFRPLFHAIKPPPSFIAHAESYPKIIVTSSVSKAWALSGARVGWVICRDQSLLDTLWNVRHFAFESISAFDEAVATEALSVRCRPALLQRTLDFGAQDLVLLDAFIEKNKDLCSWMRPVAGAAGFVRFSDADGNALDDVEFCQALVREKGVLLTPGSLCFGGASHGDFKGYVRVHFTAFPDTLKKGLALIDEFLQERYRK